MRGVIFVFLASGSLLAFGPAQQTGLPPGVKNTQDPRDVPPSPEEAVRRFQPLKGFNVTLFAGEPYVCQPIATAFDDRGRLWVAECYSYPDWHKKEGRDRILILEDTDGDGRFDRRKVFWDRAQNLTGLVLGQGGVWACCAPNLLFIPYRDGADVPAGDPIVVLDGFSLKSGHNMFNGLMWGPDGWLYGRHGILAESLVGRPGTPVSERTKINCGIWRYHPTRKLFEVVAHGTTNPWGMDFDDHGEAFFTNCVIGHLWHVVPGARYQRMYGQDYNPYAYELIESTSDHLHWGGGHWTTSRSGKGSHSEAGGGHAHVGGMIYLGDNWPDTFRNSIFMCNLHGNRINRDLLVRQGTSYVGKHAADFLLSDNPWFRGISLDYGPDGGVYITDWCDFGECHDNDGVHRSSGRIYKVFHGKPNPFSGLDLAKKSDAELVQLQLHKNDWHVRHARRLLTERANTGRSMIETHKSLRKIFDEHPQATRKLRAMWTLHTTGGASIEWLRMQLDHPDEHVRSWAIRFLVDDGKPQPATSARLADLAKTDKSGLVRLYLASALQRIPPEDRFALATNLAQHAEDANDRVQPLMLWYGIEPALLGNKVEALKLASLSRIPKLRQFIARRMTEAVGKDAAGLGPLFAMLGEATGSVQQDMLQGLRDGFKGRKSFPMPRGWQTAYPILAQSSRREVRASAHVLGLLFNDPRAMIALRKILADATLAPDERSAALQTLVAKGVPELAPELFKLMDDAAVRGQVLRSLAAFPLAETPKVILRHYPKLTPAEKQDAISTLSSRPQFALALLDAIESKQVSRSDVSAFTARQLHDLRDKKVQQRLAKVWGQIRTSPAEKKALIAKYKGLLTTDVLAKADLPRGRLVFNRTCAQCHTLFGAGNKIGPDLTGSNRFDLHYVLENMIDPSLIGNDYRLTNILTNNGRLIAGIIVEETERALTVQTATERLVLAKSDVEERRVSPISMMPEGQIEQMSLTELRDLVGYLAGKEQVPLPK